MQATMSNGELSIVLNKNPTHKAADIVEEKPRMVNIVKEKDMIL